MHYLQAGEGKTVVMLPGAGLSAELFKFQIEDFSNRFRVISLDKRGHGKSEKVEYGFRVSRFAKDLDDLISYLKLDEVIIIAHSLGASTAYNYIDLFGTERISKLVIVDEPAALLINPIWNEKERQNYGAIYKAGTLHELTNSFVSDNADELYQKIVDMMTTRHASKAQKDLILNCLDISGQAASLLYFNNISQDYRDVMRKINVPTLLITGTMSQIPWQSQRWMHEQIPHSKIEIFSEDEGGSHFMFVENPGKFNKIVNSFLSE